MIDAVFGKEENTIECAATRSKNIMTLIALQ